MYVGAVGGPTRGSGKPVLQYSDCLDISTSSYDSLSQDEVYFDVVDAHSR